MIMAVYNNDQTTFNGLWNYAKAHLNVHALMHWKIDSSGNTTGTNRATDGDEDMAFAPIVADHYAWFGTAAAKSQLDLINAFFKNIGATNIKDGYSITGTLTGQYHNAAFVSGPAAAAIASSDTTYKTAIFNENKSLTAFGT